jgi:hypothetical protein
MYKDSPNIEAQTLVSMLIIMNGHGSIVFITAASFPQGIKRDELLTFA